MPGLLRDKLVDVSGNALVKGVLVVVQAESDGVGTPVREEPFPIRVLKIFFQPPERPRRIPTEAENVFADCGGLFSEAVWFREKVRINEPKEMSELVFIPMVGRGSQEEDVVRLRCETRRQIIALRCRNPGFSILSA